MAQRDYQVLIKNLSCFEGKGFGSDQREAWDTLSTQRENILECFECEVKDPFGDEIDLETVLKGEVGGLESEIELLKDLEDVE